MVQTKVIIDSDPGTDDAGAILLLLKEPSIQVVAITVTQGNTTLKNASRNAMRILAVAGRSDIPVYAGSTNSLLNQKVKSDFYFGNDGMGDVSQYDENIGKIQCERAVPALIRLVQEHKGEIVMLCIGPVTNLALAMQIDSKFGSKLKACFIMGGNYTGRGNITPAAEFNFYRDPEAGHIVLKGMNSKNSKFLKAIGAEMARKAKAVGLKNFVLADELAAACLVNEGLILESSNVICEVETSGHLTRGQVVVDWSSLDKPELHKNVKIVTKIDVEKFKTMMEEMASI